MCVDVFCFKQKTAYEMRISDWRSDVCSSDLERIASQFRLLAWKSPLHRMRLRGRFPLKLITVPTDPISGDGAVGAAMMKGEFVHRGETVPIQSLSFANAEADRKSVV